MTKAGLRFDIEISHLGTEGHWGLGSCENSKPVTGQALPPVANQPWLTGLRFPFYSGLGFGQKILDTTSGA